MIDLPCQSIPKELFIANIDPVLDHWNHHGSLEGQKPNTECIALTNDCFVKDFCSVRN